MVPCYIERDICEDWVTDTHFTFTMRPFESTIQILLAASSWVSPSFAIAIISRWAIPRAACQKSKKPHSLSNLPLLGLQIPFYLLGIKSSCYFKAKTKSYWGDGLTSPAPWKTKVWSMSLFLVIFRAAKIPATATDAVPERKRKHDNSLKGLKCSTRIL